MSDFVMPSLGADMEAATLVKWRTEPGAHISRGDIIAEVDTDKGVIEIECFESGVVERLVLEPGTKAPVGALMAVIRGDDESAPAAAPSQAPRPPAVPPMPVAEPVPARAAGSVRVSPLARKRAADLGVDLARVTGTGPGGAIEMADVESASAHAKASPSVGATGTAAAPAPVVPASSAMRRAIAAAMAKSKREIPHYYLQTRIDMSRALAWLHGENARRPIEARLLPIVPLLKAVAHALGDVPALNGFWIDGEHRQAADRHLGVAIAMRGGGLVAPAVHHVDRLSCDELMATLGELIPRARAGRLRSSEMTDATITVTSLGDLGVETVFGIIYPPQVALVGFGRIQDQPWVDGGVVTARPVIVATLAADHRATDGHVGGQFLDALDRRLQAPEHL